MNAKTKTFELRERSLSCVMGGGGGRGDFGGGGGMGEF